MSAIRRFSFNSNRIDFLDRGRFRILGDLTMRGVTREIELDGQLNGMAGQAGGNEGSNSSCAEISTAETSASPGIRRSRRADCSSATR
ncbi:MAG: YceI family protein [Solirubrobacteraceae bacterium]